MPLQSFNISDQAKAIQDRLSAKIRAEIVKQGGKISFSKFMQMALYEPEIGYYQNNLHKFGGKGDFITAPEMGNNFAKCLARSVCQFFLDESSVVSKVLIEIGAGSGILAVNLLTELDKLGALPKQYIILEPSAQLQSQQKSLLEKNMPGYFSNISWINHLPENINGLILANEVVDAIPCERIKLLGGQWHQCGVSCDKGEFEDCLLMLDEHAKLPPLLSGNKAEKNYVDGYTTEYRPLVKGWIKALANCLDKGAILLIDYGYSEAEFYHPQRIEGSLSCFISHHSHSQHLQFVGLQDITAHVDFTQIARVAVENALEIAGFTTQAGFLLENGIVDIGNEVSDQETSDLLDSDQPTSEQRYQTSQELQKLLMPGQMGEVIKVILLTRELDIEIKGFTLQDHLHRL